jgi:RNA polymerase sigma-70 factor (ECF subfamily)
MVETAHARHSELDLEEHRAALTGHCYRMLGSAFDAEDAVQEALVRAWRGIDRFDGRSSLRTWLYRIATNVCLDMLNGRKRRAMPMDLSPASSADAPLAPPLSERVWIEPMLDSRALPAAGDPAELAAERESIRLAFVAALQHLPPRQRAVLILRDVVCWSAAEVADLLESSVASVNSALQRARATLSTVDVDDETAALAVDADDALLARYVESFEDYDIERFVSLLHEDAVQSMPPFPMWLRGPADIGAWMVGPGAECRGSRLVPLRVNGQAAFAQYRPSGPGGRLEPWSIHLPRVRDGRVVELTYFLDPPAEQSIFALFGLPDHLDG